MAANPITLKPLNGAPADPAYIARCLRVFAEPGQVVELRVLGVDRKGTVAGYYDDLDKLARDAARLDGRGQIYFALNPLDPALIGRYCNRLEEWAKDTTADKDVLRRRWLFADFDPARPAGVSATESEKAAAEAVMRRCREWLTARGWPAPVVGDSGNGWHLLYRIDLPNDDASRDLVSACLQALSFRFSGQGVKVDETTFNAARICKLYGVLASKGDDTTGKTNLPPRPHRHSRLLEVPNPVNVVPRDLLEALAATRPKPPEDTPRQGLKMRAAGRFDVGQWLREHGVGVAADAAWGDGGHKWILKNCPWNEAHTNRSAYVVQLKSGAVGAGCHHDGCAGKTWADVRDRFEPGWRDRAGSGSSSSAASNTAGATVGSVGRRKPIRPLPPWQPFPVEELPPVLREYVVAAAEAIGCDPALVALPSLATIAGCIGNSRAIILKKGWVEPSVIWSATIAESGGHKSPGYHAAVNPLVELQMDDFDAYHAEVEQFNNRLAEWMAMPKDQRREEDKPEKPKEPPTYVTSDTTIEALGELLRDAPRGLLVARDELDGWFQSFTRYKGKAGGSDRSAWLELHRAGPLVVNRLTRDRGPLRVRRACASLTGTIQPAVLARALDREALDAGLGARFLLAMPPKRRRVWTERELPDDLAQRYRLLLKALLDLPLENATRRNPYVLGLSCNAKAEWVRFFNEWGGVQYGAEGEQASAFAKIEAYATRLALVHHVVGQVAAGESDRRSILQGSMRAGIALARWFASELTRVYAMLHEQEDERLARKLVEWVSEHGERVPDRPAVRVTTRALQRSNSRRWPTSEHAEAELDSLVGLGLGCWVDGPAPQAGGHRPRWFELTLPTHDTSDARRPGEDDQEADTRPDGRQGGDDRPWPLGDGNDEESSGSVEFDPEALDRAS